MNLGLGEFEVSRARHIVVKSGIHPFTSCIPRKQRRARSSSTLSFAGELKFSRIVSSIISPASETKASLSSNSTNSH